MAEPHALEHLGNGDEHQRGTSLQGIRVTAGEGEHCRNDHQTCHDGNGRIEDLHVLGGFLNGNVLFHVGTKGHENAHGNGQRVEHLPHGGDDGHPGKIGHVGHQEVLDACQCTRTGDRVNGNDHRQDHQNRHHQLGHPFHTIAYPGKNDDQRKNGKDEETHLCRQTAGNKAGKIAVLCQLTAVAADIRGKIPDDPAANDRIIRYDQNWDDGIDPAA